MADYTNGLGGAAAAFETDLGGGSQKPSGKGGQDGPTETLFGDQEFVEDEDEVGPEDEDDSEEGEVDDDESSEDEESDEGDEESEDEDEDEGKDAEGTDLESVVKVKVDGEEVEVPLKEAIEGYIRTETFHKRLNLLNEAKVAIESQAVEVQQTRVKYMEGLQALTEQLDQITPKEPDWDELYRTNPAEARQLETKWNEFKAQRAALDEEKKKASEEALKEEYRKTVQYIQSEEVKLLKKIPAWHDKKVKDADTAEMTKTALAEGFTPEEISKIYDSRMVVILKKAAAYDKMTAKKPVPTKVSETRPVTPGSGNPKRGTVRKGGDRAMKQLSRTGSLSDATNVFANIIRK